MINYIIRRIGYGVLILIGVNLFTFMLFFTVNTPDDMARMNIGGKRVTPDAIEKWKVERGYDKPLFWNSKEEGVRKLTNTIFVERSVQLFAFDFGASDSGRDIGYELKRRVGPSIALAIPTLAVTQRHCGVPAFRDVAEQHDVTREPFAMRSNRRDANVIDSGAARA